MKSILEVDQKLCENWYTAALSNEVTSAAPIVREVYGVTYVLFRTNLGQVAAIEDRCLHRGTKLSLGKCTTKGITCPYHGWTYDQNGLVIDIPSEGPATTELENSVKQRKWQANAPKTIEQDGVIWLWAGKQPPAEESKPWSFPFYGDSKWTGYFMVTDFENEVEHLVQNFMDVPHTVFVHSKWFRDKAQLEVPYRLTVKDGRVKATYLQPADSIGGFMGRLVNPKKESMIHTDEFIFPNLTRVDYLFGEYGFIINSQCTPINRYKSKVYTWIAYRGVSIAPVLKPLIHFYTRKVIQQDVEIMANQGSNLKKYDGFNQWKSTAADDIHLAITRLREVGRTDPKSAFDIQLERERKFWI